MQIKYGVLVNDKDVTTKITPHLVSIQLTDNEKDKSDELTIVVGSKFKRPKYSDKIKIYLGGRFAGLFHVQKTSIRNNKELTITATGIDFNSQLKERKHERHEQISLADLAAKVAARHGLQVKSDVNITRDVEQVNESDLAMLNRLAKEHSCIFNIKNGILYFMQRAVEPPAVSIDIDDCIDSDIEHSNTKLYKSCTVIYQNTKLNKVVKVTVGDGSPVLNKHGHFQSDNEAKLFAENALKRANQGTAKGSATISGRIIFAGSKLSLDNETYTTTRVEHTLSNDSGWQTTLNFNNQNTPET